MTPSNNDVDWSAIPFDEYEPEVPVENMDFEVNLAAPSHQLANLNSVLDSLTTRLYDGKAELRKTTQLLHSKHAMIAETRALLRSLSSTFAQNHNAIPSSRQRGTKHKSPGILWKLVPLLRALEEGKVEGMNDGGGEVEEEEEVEATEEEEGKEELKVVSAEVWRKGEYGDVLWLKLQVKNCGRRPLRSLYLYPYHTDPCLAPRSYRHEAVACLHPGQETTLTALVTPPPGLWTGGRNWIGMMCWYRCSEQNGGGINGVSGANTVEEEEGEEGVWKSVNVREVVWRGIAELETDEVGEDVDVHLTRWLVEGAHVLLPSCAMLVVTPPSLSSSSPHDSLRPTLSLKDTYSSILSVLLEGLEMRPVKEEHLPQLPKAIYQILTNPSKTLVATLSPSIPNPAPHYTLHLRALDDRLLHHSIGVLAHRLCSRGLEVSLDVSPRFEVPGPGADRAMDELRMWILAVHDATAESEGEGEKWKARKQVERRRDVCLASVSVGVGV